MQSIARFLAACNLAGRKGAVNEKRDEALQKNGASKKC